MEDRVINLVKNNQYFIKSPFDGEIISIFISNDEELEINQKICLLKTDNSYVELDCEFPGIVNDILVDVGSTVKRWDVVAVVDVKENYDDVRNLVDFNFEANSEDYNLIYNFQQHDLARYIYDNIESFIKRCQRDDKTVFNLIDEIYDDENLIIPFKKNDLNVYCHDIGDIRMVQIIWPDFKSPLLAHRIYILVDESGNAMYFACEKSLDGKLMISSIIDENGHLTRYNYGRSPESIDLEKERIVEIFNGFDSQP